MYISSQGRYGGCRLDSQSYFGLVNIKNTQRQSVVNLKVYQICGNKFFGIYVCCNNVLYIKSQTSATPYMLKCNALCTSAP